MISPPERHPSNLSKTFDQPVPNHDLMGWPTPASPEDDSGAMAPIEPVPPPSRLVPEHDHSKTESGLFFLFVLGVLATAIVLVAWPIYQHLTYFERGFEATKNQVLAVGEAVLAQRERNSLASSPQFQQTLEQAAVAASDHPLVQQPQILLLDDRGSLRITWTQVPRSDCDVFAQGLANRGAVVHVGEHPNAVPRQRNIPPSGPIVQGCLLARGDSSANYIPVHVSLRGPGLQTLPALPHAGLPPPTDSAASKTWGTGTDF